MSQLNDDAVKDVTAMDAVKGVDSKDPNDMELEQLLSLLLTDRLNQLQEKSTDEFKELKKRQEEVVHLHKILKAMNSSTNSDSELIFEIDGEMITHLNDLKTKYDIDIPAWGFKDGKFCYTKDERERLIDNIRMTIDDHNTKNDMQMQTVTRLINERYESYQMARAILKPIHDDKMNKARAIAGR